MGDSHGEAVAPRAGPGPCRCGGNVALEAWAGVRVGWVLSRESILSSGADGVAWQGRPHEGRR